MSAAVGRVQRRTCLQNPSSITLIPRRRRCEQVLYGTSNLKVLAMSRPPKLCVYCGQPGVTKEHIRGDWSQKYALSRSKIFGHIVKRYQDGDYLSKSNSKDGHMKRPGGSRSTTLKIACGNCNRGWMKAIVDAAIPILKPLDFGFWGNLSDEDQQKIASWIALYTMSFEFGDRETVCVSQTERFLFRESSVPSHHWRIAIGYGNFFRDIDWTIHRAMSIHPEISYDGHRKTQITAFSHGHLVAMSYYSESILFEEFTKIVQRSGLEPIWPRRDTILTKPFQVKYDGDMEDLVNNLTAALSR